MNLHLVLAATAAGMAALVQTTAAAAQSQPIPIETFAEPANFSQPELSPSGDKIAALMEVDGEQRLVVISTTGEAPKTFAGGTGDDEIEINWMTWATDDWLAVGIGAEQKVQDQFVYVTRLAGLSADLENFVQVDWGKAGRVADRVIHYFPDSTKVLLAKQEGFKRDEWGLAVYEADLATGKADKELGSREFVSRWSAGPNGKVRLGTGHNPRSGKDFALYRDGSGGFDFVDLEDDDAYVPLAYYDNDTAAVLSDKDGFIKAYKMDIAGMKLGEMIYSVEGYDIDNVLRDPYTKQPIGIRYTTTGTRYEWFKPELKAAQDLLNQNLGEGRAYLTSWSDDYKKFIVYVGGPSEAGKYLYWDTAKAPALLGYRNLKLKDQALNPVSTIRYTARDGVEIESVLTLPRLREHKDLPLIVLPHGGPGVRDEERFDWWTQALAELGYAVLQPNYRGSTGYGTEFFDLGVGEWGLKMQDDLVDAIAWADEEGLADKDRVCIVGASYGGYAALRGAQRDGEHYRCAISFAGVGDLSAMVRRDRFYLLGRMAKDYWNERVEDFSAVSPEKHPHEFSIPVLLVHGKEDVRVPVDQSQDMYKVLKAAGKDVTYIEQEEGDHNFSRDEDKIEFLRATRDFLAKHNPA
ncbi:alpha/beta hydrolase family protein [Sphingomicrobium clamense]|uniref:S9 family peptidase n=1 Tax=Sphingomicrobium clamense TaxID=2851013 RepID=A0ABS6V468_9SPHN|nr:S9 family peptidase [Sphingomicrobium sp. B8]MBW0144155.1 S9 family peptidase [Sphingomicrobium sp. B8]